MLVLNIGANIIAIMAFVAFLNEVINWFGIVIGIEDLSFEVKLCHSSHPLMVADKLSFTLVAAWKDFHSFCIHLGSR